MKVTRRDDALRAGADRVARVLREAGHQALFAGGCVRDLVLGLAPKDYDIATDATPDQVRALFRRTVLVGAAFGVVRVLIDGNREYEVATFRTEGSYMDGRRPEAVTYTTSARKDVERRDFTMNALLLDPETDTLVDHVGGLADLHGGLIRAVGEPVRRFAEDKLRMLRAVRFVARFGFEIEPATWAAIAQHAPELGQVSVERVVTELHGIFASSRPGRALAALFETGLWAAALPWAANVDRARLGECLERLASSSELDAESAVTVAWALVLDLAAPPDAEAVLYAAKLSRDRIRAVLFLLGARPSLFLAHEAPLADRARTLVSPYAPLARAFLAARHGPTAPAALALDALASDHAARPLPALPLIGGAELKSLGLTPGPEFKDILRAVETEALERRLTTREEALAFARAYLERARG